MSKNEHSVRPLLVIAGLLGASGVLFGAFGAHGLAAVIGGGGEVDPEWLTKRLNQFDAGVRYHLLHAVALLAFSSHTSRYSPFMVRVIAGCWAAGVAIFSGLLYALVLTNTPVLGAIVPIGGALMIAGWLALASCHHDNVIVAN